MKKIKINFKYFGENFDPENNFFTNLLRKKYNVAISENPDYMFYSVYSEKNFSKDFSEQGDLIRKFSPFLYRILRKIYSKVFFFNQKKNLEIKGDFIKIFYDGEHTMPNMDECDWAFSSYFEEEINNPRYMRLPVYVVNDFMLGKKAIPPVKKKINFETIKKEKTKFCNFIYSQEVPFRNKFFRKLSKYKKIDAPGRCMNNMQPIGKYKNAKNSRSSKHWIEEKIDFIKNYKFTIAFENAFVPGYVTEKLTHPMVASSIPIYFGHPSVVKDFNPKSFINYNDFKNIKEMINHIIEVDSDDKLYRKYLEEPFYNKGSEAKYFDEERYLKKFEKIFG